MCIVLRRYTVKLYPNQKTRQSFETWRDHCRFVWNIALEQRLDAWRKGRFPSKFEQSRQLTELKQECEWLRNSPAFMLKEVLGSLDVAMKRCWKKTSRRPRFKSGKRDDHVQMLMQCAPHYVKNGFLHVEKVGFVRFRGLKKLPGRLKSFNLVKRAGSWYASLLFNVEHIVPKLHEHHDKVTGLDRGITSLIADSDGNLIDNPRFFERSMCALRQAQRKLCRRKKGSNRRTKAKLAIARLHRHVANQRHDFLHKLSTTYAKNHGVVVVEDLKPSKMVHFNRGLSRSIMDASWSTFSSMLEYKLEARGGQLVKVNPAYTSQRCVACGHTCRENRNGKTFRCVICGHVDDADLNAAKNIKQRGVEQGKFQIVESLRSWRA